MKDKNLRQQLNYDTDFGQAKRNVESGNAHLNFFRRAVVYHHNKKRSYRLCFFLNFTSTELISCKNFSASIYKSFVEEKCTF